MLYQSQPCNPHALTTTTEDPAGPRCRSIQGSRRLVNDLNQMAHEDALTGLINRRQLDEVLAFEPA